MRSNKLEIRGCCFGIPIGCGSLMLIVLGVAASQVSLSSLSGFTALKLVMVAVSILALSVGILLTLGGIEEKRRKHEPA